MSEREITELENNIVSLRQQSKSLTMPRRSIAYQFQNMRNGNRDVARELAIRRKEKLKISNKVLASRNKIVSLRETLLRTG
jgi:hypothetical protein